MAFIFRNKVIMETENKQDLNKKEEKWWMPVMIFYAKTTSWIILPLVLSVFGGRYVSKTIGSQVVFFLFVILGFLITCFGIYREIKNYKKTIDN